MHKLWFKDGRIMPRYLNKLLELMDKYENKETEILTKYNLSGDIYDTSSND